MVGSVALDSVKTPSGESREALGGSAVYFSLSARLFGPVSMIGVVGEDFPEAYRRMLLSRDIDIDGLKILPGRTFRWVGRFERDLKDAETLATHLNVFEGFRPRLSPVQKDAPVLFLGNIDPEIQWEVLSQMSGPKLVACDTMNYWIALKKPALKELMSRIGVFFVNEEEAKDLTGEPNLFKAARRISEWGPSVVVIKKGEHGAMILLGGRPHSLPAFPVESVKDPTGSGDSFAGAFLGCLAAQDCLERFPSFRDSGDVFRWKKAAALAICLASFNVEDFGTRRLEGITREELDGRFREYLDLLRIEDPIKVS